MSETVSIPARFNGPLNSGNGGYSSGVVAGFVGETAEVALRRPVPLDEPLAVERDDGAVRLLDRDALVAEGRPAAVELDLPAPVGVEEARDAMSRYRGSREGMFSRCFVCGLGRDDAFGVYAGEVGGRELVASTWTPPAWTAGDDGHVRPEFVWSVLDCPTYFAVYLGQDLRMGVLARLAARIDAPAIPGEEHVVMSWPLETDGRKRHAGAALLSADGEPLAVARALLIEPRAP